MINKRELLKAFEETEPYICIMVTDKDGQVFSDYPKKKTPDLAITMVKAIGKIINKMFSDLPEEGNKCLKENLVVFFESQLKLISSEELMDYSEKSFSEIRNNIKKEKDEEISTEEEILKAIEMLKNLLPKK